MPSTRRLRFHEPKPRGTKSTRAARKHRHRVATAAPPPRLLAFDATEIQELRKKSARNRITQRGRDRLVVVVVHDRIPSVVHGDRCHPSIVDLVGRARARSSAPK